MDVPAFCDTCGAVFRSGVVAENVTNISFGNVGAGPCPVCGGMGHIPDGVFNFIGNTIEILSAPRRTVEELSRLAKIIREARERKETPEQVAEKIRNEIPTLADLADLLPRTREELYAFLALIVAVIALVGQSGDGKKESTNITVTQTINQVFIETEKAAQPPPKPTTTPKKIGRNALCPCGSGKKYKKCCGKVQ